jgi:hypothetical protein
MVLCSVEGCGRKHAAHGFCLMHYKRVQKHGTPEYRWGGKEVGRQCLHCDRPVTARELCVRHYQMWHRHGDALFADKRKVDGLPAGEHKRRGYKMVTPAATALKAVSASLATVEKTDRAHAANFEAKGLRDGSQRSRRQWEHRKVAKAQAGQIVHHIDGDPLNNARENLHVFNSPAEHARAHRSLEKAAYGFLRAGLLVFDPESGCYLPAQSSPQPT